MDDIFGTAVEINVINDQFLLCVLLIQGESRVHQSFDEAHPIEYKEFDYWITYIENHGANNDPSDVLVPVDREVCVSPLIPEVKHSDLRDISINHQQNGPCIQELYDKHKLSDDSSLL